MILWQANIGRGVTPAEFRTNLDRVLRAGGRRAVFAFQEIDEADAPNEMDYLQDRTWRTHRIVGSTTAVPILVPKHIAVIEEHETLACKGLAKFTPHRPIVEALLGLPSGVEAAVLNVHVPINRPQTATRRRAARQALKARARSYDNGVWVSDTNTRRGWPTIARGERTVTDAGIDKAKAWAAPGRRVVVDRRRTVELSIDGHNAHGAWILWPRTNR